MQPVGTAVDLQNQRLLGSIPGMFALSPKFKSFGAKTVYNIMEEFIMNKKLCTGCNQELEVSSFRTNKTKKDGLQSQCIDCRKAYNKVHYKQNKQVYVDKAKLTNAKIKVWYKEFKSTLSCSNCPENHPACLHFHHKDPTQKGFTIAAGVTFSKKKIKEEMSKCIVLCANCHAKLHYDERI